MRAGGAIPRSTPRCLVARIGFRIMGNEARVDAASNAPVNLLSRSRTGKLVPWSAPRSERLVACTVGKKRLETSASDQRRCSMTATKQRLSARSRPTTTLVGPHRHRHRRRPGRQRRTPDAALLDDSLHLVGEDARRNREGNIRVVVCAGRPGGARRLLPEHVMSLCCASPGCRDRSMLGRGSSFPLTGPGSRGGPRGVWSPRTTPLLVQAT